MKKRVIQIVVTLVFSAVALYLAFRGIEFEAVGQAFRQVAWGWLILTQLLIFGTLVRRAERWRVLLDQKVSLRDSFGLINIGYLIIKMARDRKESRGLHYSIDYPRQKPQQYKPHAESDYSDL